MKISETERRPPGRPFNIVDRLIEFDVAIKMAVGKMQARRMIREWGTDSGMLLRVERVQRLRELGSSKDGMKYLVVMEQEYLAHRRAQGFNQ